MIFESDEQGFLIYVILVIILGVIIGVVRNYRGIDRNNSNSDSHQPGEFLDDMTDNF